MDSDRYSFQQNLAAMQCAYVAAYMHIMVMSLDEHYIRLGVLALLGKQFRCKK